MSKRTLILIILAALLLPSGVSAQSNLTLSLLHVSLWPEYDQPSMLVIYDATLSPEVQLPAELTFKIPATAGGPTAVAVRQGDNQLYTVAHTSQMTGEWEAITFMATTPEVRLEYYDPGLTMADSKRDYIFHWPGDYTVDSLVFEVLRPVGASNMNTNPELGNPVTSSTDGLTYYRAEVGSFQSGQEFTLTLNYTKTSDTLTAENLPVQPSAPVNPSPSAINIRSILPWVLAAMPWILATLGLALIVFAVFWYRQTGREKSPVRTRRRKAAQPAIEPAGQDSGVYCHNCGRRAEPGDRFCRSCGVRLRIE